MTSKPGAHTHGDDEPPAAAAQRAFPLSRRELLRQLGLAPLLLRPSAFAAFARMPGPAALRPSSPLPGAPQFGGERYIPQYPARSPLEDVLRLVQPGLDQYPTERDAAALESTLAAWAVSLQAGGTAGIEALFAPHLQASPFAPTRETRLRDGFGIECFTRTFGPPQPISREAFCTSMRAWLGAVAKVQVAEFQVNALDDRGGTPRVLVTSVRYSLTTRKDDGGAIKSVGAIREQRVGYWQMHWMATDDTWKVTALEASTEVRTVLHGPGFNDVTQAALGADPFYRRQLVHGSDYWRTLLDGACGIDVYGNNGVAVGDFNNDGLDDLYVSQPAGLPNRLYRNRGDGTLEDVTERAGVGVLDNTACALFADFRNLGLQDLLVVCGSGPLLFVNQGDGTFQRKPDAFRFALPPAGTFTHAAIADYDRDGRLDIYFCLYSYYLGLDQYHYPTPYFDARNGPPNFLMHNEGDGTFADRTQAAGLNAQNDRYSFACAWNETDGRYPELYVVNDFGRNNLYRSKPDGTFEAVSDAAHVQDVGAGMSAAWADYSNSGRAGIYAANMWSAAGQRVSHLPAFHAAASPAIRELYQRHARGNALYRSNAEGIFTNVSQQAGVEMGRWAWGSDFVDFDRDGHADIYVTNGYITAPTAAREQFSSVSETDREPDLGSFFWRQVVGRSPDDATPSPAYEHGWNALNELIRTDSSWSGNERNVLLLNNGDGTFAEASGPVGLDFLEDGRCFALADLDGDGRLEIVVKNRNGPQLRILHNSMPLLGDGIAFRLRGTASNRDAIGTLIQLQCGALTQTRSLQAGSGFLAQHTKEQFFGLGNGSEAVHATVRWPNGIAQSFSDLPRNCRIQLVEGDAAYKAVPFAITAKAYAASPGNVDKRSDAQAIPASFGTWLLDPLKSPVFTLPDASGKSVALEQFRGRPVLLCLGSSAAPAWQQHLRALDAIPPATLAVLALTLDSAATQSALPRQALHFPTLFATAEVGGIYNIIFRYLFDRRANLPLPTSFLMDSNGMIVKVYQGTVSAAELLADARQIPKTAAERRRLALPFAGTLYLGSFERNDFTFGVAMFQHGYLDEAAASFAQVIAAQPNDAEAHYNLGTLNLRRNNFAEARDQLRKTLALKPDYPEAWNNLGMMAAQDGRTQEAIDSFTRSLALRPGYATALLNLGNLYRHERSFTQAQDYLDRALKLEPDDPEANYSMGMLYAQQARFPTAADFLEKAVTLRPDYSEALNNLGVLYVRQGDNAKAEEQFLTCIRLSPAYEGTYLNLARLYLTEGDRARARKAVEDLLRVHPENAAGKQALQALGPG
jgi:tetratricopeptide (TPR) repeat protein